MRSIIVIVLLFALTISCDDESSERPFPRVKTYPAYDITKETVSFSGEITFTPGEIIDHGFTVSKNASITVDLNYALVVSLGSRNAIGKFHSTINSALAAGELYYVRAFAKSKDHVVFGELEEFVSLGSAAPSIETVVPLEGTWGDTVVINGARFSPKQWENEVRFADVTAKVIGASNNQLKVIVPSGLDVLDAPVKVSVAKNVAVSGERFNLFKPQISSVSPNSAFVGAEISIVGKYFHSQRVEALIDDVPVELKTRTKTELRLKIPETVSFGNRTLKVTTGQGDLQVTTQIEVKAPAIQTISPETGTFLESVKIVGSGFAPTLQANRVYFGEVPATILSGSTTELNVAVPTGIPTSSAAIRLSLNGTDVYSSTPFTLKPPTLDNVSQEVVFAGEVFSITGDYFNPEPAYNQVSFDGQPLEVVSASRNELSVRFPIEVRVHEKQLKVTVATQMAESGSIYSPWIRLQDFPGVVLGATASVVYNDNVYLGTGGEPSSTNRQFYRFTPATNTWTKLKNFPAENRFYALAFAGNGKVFMGGGAGKSDFYRYDIATDTWTQIGFLPFSNGNSYIGFSFSSLNKHFVLLYTDYMKAQLLEFDAVTETWAARETVNLNIDFDVLCYVAGNTFYINAYGGGFMSFSGVDETWTVHSDVLPLHQYGFGFSLGSNCYLSGEYDSYNYPTTRAYRFDLGDKTLNDYGTYMGPPRTPGAFFQVGGKGYLVSGYFSDYWNGSGFDRRVYEFVPKP